MDLREQTCCFTGHRLLPPGMDEILYSRVLALSEELIAQGYTRFASGGALGFDQLAARVILSLKHKHPQIKLLMVLPCRTQAAKWSPPDAALYGEILSRSDSVQYICDHYTPSCMFMRNRALVDMSSVCICYQTHDGGGTAYTVNYAHKRGLDVINAGSYAAEKKETKGERYFLLRRK